MLLPKRVPQSALRERRRDIGHERPVATASCRAAHLVWHAALVRTPGGDRRADRLVPGDVVITRDHGDQVIQDIQALSLGRMALICDPRSTPIMLGQGALGGGLPIQTLLVSPASHVAGIAAAPEGAVPVSHFVGRDSVARVFPEAVTYCCLVLSGPAEIALAGLWHSPNAAVDASEQAGDPYVLPIGWQSLGAVSQRLQTAAAAQSA